MKLCDKKNSHFAKNYRDFGKDAAYGHEFKKTDAYIMADIVCGECKCIYIRSERID
jgi:hypothetical protein